jgi:Skp family chaperone for outer membrane proteins
MQRKDWSAMKGCAIARLLALGLFISAAPVFAQAPAAPAGQKPPVPAGQQPTPAPAGQQPATPPAAPPPTPAPQPPAPFPQGAKVAYVNLQQIASLSVDGKAAQGKVQALTQKKQTEIVEKQKALQGNQQKLQTSGGVMNEAARATLEKEIDRQTRDLERAQQDAQAELNELTGDLQAEFNKKLFPVLEQISKEKGLHFLFSGADAGLIWAEPGLDLTLEAVKKLDAGKAAPKP